MTRASHKQLTREKLLIAALVLTWTRNLNLDSVTLFKSLSNDQYCYINHHDINPKEWQTIRNNI